MNGFHSLKQKKLLTLVLTGLLGTILIGSIIYTYSLDRSAADMVNSVNKDVDDSKGGELSENKPPDETTKDDDEEDKEDKKDKPKPSENTGSSNDVDDSNSPIVEQPSETPSAPKSPEPISTPPPSGGCSLPSRGDGGYPLPNLAGYANVCNTGPRYPCTTTQGTLITTHDGQLIDRVCINGTLEIRHNNVTVRDVLVMGTGTYSLDIGQYTSTCPSNLRVEYTEINMTNAANMDWGIYQRCAGGHVFDHIKVLYAGRGMMTYGNLTLNQSYIYSNRTQPDAHRTAFSTHGGSDFTITGNTLICVNTGCSSSLNIYSDYAPATDVLIQRNVFAGGSICLRGGETHTYASQTSNIRVLDNRFSTVYAPECGTLQAFAQFDESAPGNIRSGNIWHESGSPITGE